MIFQTGKEIDFCRVVKIINQMIIMQHPFEHGQHGTLKGLIFNFCRRRYIFDVLKHVRLPLVATKLLESYVNNCTDLSLKVAMSSVKKDLISQKGSLVALYVKPRKSAKKNIYVIGGMKQQIDFDTIIIIVFQVLRENWEVPGPEVNALIKLWSALILSNKNGKGLLVWI